MPEAIEIRALYEAYIAQAEKLERERRPGAGLFGLPGGPKDDPCHGRFYEELGALLAAYAGEEHDPAEVRELLEYIFTAPLEHREPRSSYWMLLAAHGLTPPLAARLTREDAEELRRRYEKAYPRRERLPIQNQALDALKRQAK